MEGETKEVSDNDFSNDVNSSNSDATGDKEFADTTEKPSTEEEMRACKYCKYQAPDWPV